LRIIFSTIQTLKLQIILVYALKWARKFGTQRKTNKYKDLIINLTVRQKDLLIGSMLGDGQLTKVNDGFEACKEKQSSFIEVHCLKQEEYIKWKYNELKCFLPKLKEIDNSGFPAYELRTIRHPILTDMEKEWYARDDLGRYIKRNGNRLKIVPRNISLSPLSLAVWYLDDGWRPKRDRQIFISTYGFGFDDCEFLLCQIKNLGISNCHVRKRQYKRDYPEIVVGASSSLDFLNLIENQVAVSCFEYKTVKRVLHHGRICAIPGDHVL
jgi:hypothetical protein